MIAASTTAAAWSGWSPDDRAVAAACPATSAVAYGLSTSSASRISITRLCRRYRMFQRVPGSGGSWISGMTCRNASQRGYSRQ